MCDKSTLQAVLSSVTQKARETFNGALKSVILFGSYANGTNHEDSDIDLAIVSKDIKNEFEDGVKLMSLTWGIDTRIEPHAINTDDFNIIDTPFIDEIIKNGVELYAVV